MDRSSATGRYRRKDFSFVSISSNFIHVFETCRALLRTSERGQMSPLILIHDHKNIRGGAHKAVQQGSARFEDVNEI